MISHAIGSGRVLQRAILVAITAFSLSAYAQKTVEVVIQDYRFQPQELQIKVGDTVKWINKEKRTSHSVVLPVDQGGESERFFPDESWQRRFDAPGRYTYRCGPHPEMSGVIDVAAP